MKVSFRKYSLSTYYVPGSLHWKCSRIWDKVPTVWTLFYQQGSLTESIVTTGWRWGAAVLLGECVAPVVHCSSWHSLDIFVCPNACHLLLFQFPAWPLQDSKFKPCEPQVCRHRVRPCWLSTVKTSIISVFHLPSSWVQPLAVRRWNKSGFVVGADVVRIQV